MFFVFIVTSMADLAILGATISFAGKEDCHSFKREKIRDKFKDVLFNSLLQASEHATNIPTVSATDK